MMNMNAGLREAFSVIKPACDAVYNGPTAHNIGAMVSQVCSLDLSAVQEMQLYLLFPFVYNLKSSEIRNRYGLIQLLVDAMKLIIEKITITTPEMFMNYHTPLLKFLYDGTRINVVTDIPEELKHSIINTLTTMMLKLKMDTRIQIYKEQLLTMAHTIYLAVQIAKTDKLRVLRKSGLNCMICYTGTHDFFTNATYQIRNKQFEVAVLDMNACILPGTLAALQDVATSTDNPGHGVIVLAVNGIHRMVRLVMNDRFLKTKEDVTIEDFATILQAKEKEKQELRSRLNPSRKPKDTPKMTPEWFATASHKLQVVVKSLSVLQTHDNVKVRQELAEFCGGMLVDCSRTMQPSMKFILNILIALSRDEYPEISKYCTEVLDEYFNNISSEAKRNTLDKVGESFLGHIARLDRVLNDIDSSSKLAMLNLLHGYVSILTVRAKPERLTMVLSQHEALTTVCEALVQAAHVDTTVSLLANVAVRDMTPPVIPSPPPWSALPLLPSATLHSSLRGLVGLLATPSAAPLLADTLGDMMTDVGVDTPAILRLLNWIGGAPNCPIDVTKSILSKYVEHDFWYLPLEVYSGEDPITQDESLDPEVYNPRAWEKDSVPGLYEGATEIRYTGISYSEPRRQRLKNPNYCSTLSEAQRNLVISCLLTEGVGLFAKRLREQFRPYLMKNLCMILERVGSKYELLHLAGSQTLNVISETQSYSSVADFIGDHSDYFAFLISMRLKKSWNNQSALEILSVVMEYSDAGTMFDCLYGLVEDVLLKSCQEYHATNLTAYLQVFLTLLCCIKKWFPSTIEKGDKLQENKIDFMSEDIEFIRSQDQLDRALNQMSIENDEILDENDDNDQNEDHDMNITEEKAPLPKHINLAVIITKLCINFIPSKNRHNKLLALQIIDNGLQILVGYENELLPLNHQIWSPLRATFDQIDQPVVLRAAFELLITMVKVSRDYLRSRVMKEVFPKFKSFMESSSKESYLKDVGSAYRLSAAYRLQQTMLEGFPTLVIDLALENEYFDDILEAVEPYISNRQPKPLQALAVKFYKRMLKYDRGSVWYYFRKMCNNDEVLEPPNISTAQLDIIIGTPFETTDKTINKNIEAIFDGF